MVGSVGYYALPLSTDASWDSRRMLYMFCVVFGIMGSKLSSTIYLLQSRLGAKALHARMAVGATVGGTMSPRALLVSCCWVLSR